MPASSPSRRLALTTTLTGLIAAPLAVVATAVPAHAEPVDIQILGTNDFHGRLLANGAEAGAAQFAGAVAQLESENPNTIFAAAGDLIGASTFESFIQKDRPTLQALNAAGLDVSSAGNHEFDQGYSDLVNRVMAPWDETTNPEGGADWQYIAANVRKRVGGAYALPDVTARTPDPVDCTWTVPGSSRWGAPSSPVCTRAPVTTQVTISRSWCGWSGKPVPARSRWSSWHTSGPNPRLSWS